MSVPARAWTISGLDGRLFVMRAGLPRVYLAVAVALAAGAAILHAQSAQKRLTLDDIYDPSTQVNFSGAVPQTEWFDDDTYLMRRRGTPWRKVNAATGESSPLADVERMENALAALPGVTRGEAGAAARGALEFNR